MIDNKKATEMIAKSPSHMMALQEKYQAAIEPMLKMKLNIMNSAVPKIMVYQDGTIEREYPKRTRELLSQCDKVIDIVSENFCRLFWTDDHRNRHPHL